MEERFLRISRMRKEQEEHSEFGTGRHSFSDAAQGGVSGTVGLMKDAIQLKQTPRRIPICPSAGFSHGICRRHDV
jgi:hypothetical protein